MTALVLAAVLGAAPVGRVLDRAAVQLARLERLDRAAAALDDAEAAIGAARSPAERRTAWRAWFRARHELRKARAR